MSFIQNLGNLLKGPTFQNSVSGHGTVSCNVTEPPNDLFDDLHVWRVEQLQEVSDDVLLDQTIHMVRGTRSDVRDAPRSLELEFRDRVVQELNENYS